MTDPQQMAKAAADVAAGVGVASSPWWVPFLREGLDIVAIAAGVALAFIRIAIGIREWRSGKNRNSGR